MTLSHIEPQIHKKHKKVSYLPISPLKETRLLIGLSVMSHIFSPAIKRSNGSVSGRNKYDTWCWSWFTAHQRPRMPSSLAEIIWSIHLALRRKMPPGRTIPNLIPPPPPLSKCMAIASVLGPFDQTSYRGRRTKLWRDNFVCNFFV